MEDRRDHWENVYATKTPNEVSWTQELPATSLAFIRSFNLPKDAPIIDIGGGDSKLADYLLQEGYTDITVLDIAAASLEKAQTRLGDKAGLIKWIVSDITHFEPATSYACWHDRAAFHFLTTREQVEKYIAIARQCVKEYLIIGTFSHDGPKKCSGLDIQQYNEAELQEVLAKGFTKINCVTEDHLTPFNTKQHFLFCSFKANASIC